MGGRVLDGARHWRRFPAVLFWRLIRWLTQFWFWKYQRGGGPLGAIWIWVESQRYGAEERFEGRL